MNRPSRVLSSLALALTGLALVAPAQLPAAAAPVEPRPAPGVVEGRGTWTVSSVSEDTWAVSWRSPTRLPITGDRPTIVTTVPARTVPAGTPLGVPTVAADGRTVETVVVSADEPRPSQLDVVLSGQALDEPRSPEVGSERRGSPSPDWTPPRRRKLGADPAQVGAWGVVSEDYRLPRVELPGLKEPVEMVGHVVRPSAADDSHPLVVLLHGRHAWCYDPRRDELTWDWPCDRRSEPVPSHLGYQYVQRTLASQGYVTVSIAANGINAQDGLLPDGGADARSRLVRAHLEAWDQWVDAGRYQADLQRIVLVGHSRGGMGVSRAALEIPLSAPYEVAGQVLIAPTNFAHQTTPYVDTVTLLPSCDGDVYDLQGQRYTDVSRGLLGDDTSMKSSVFVVGANHNFFNSEWTPGPAASPVEDDWGARRGACGPSSETRLTAKEQRKVGRAYIAGAVRLFAGGEDAFRPMFDGSATRVRAAGDAVVLSHALGLGRTFRHPGGGARLTTPVGAETQLCQGLTPFDDDPDQCGHTVSDPGATPHWPDEGAMVPTRRAFELSWDAAGGRGGLRFRTPLDLSRDAHLDLRTVVDNRTRGVAVDLVVTDSDGASVRVTPPDGGRLPAFPTGPRWYPGKYWARTLRVPTSDLSGIDLTRVRSVELVGTSASGRLWVLDVASTPGRAPAVPPRRAPIVDLGTLTVSEGGPGVHTAEVPFTVRGRLREPAAIRVYGTNQVDGSSRTRTVQIPAGARRGTIAWTYSGDDQTGLPRIVHVLSGYALHGVMVRDDQGRLVIREDDPHPAITVRPTSRVYVEGEEVRWRVTLDRPLGYEARIFARALRGDSPASPLQVNDLTASWVRRYVDARPRSDAPLHEVEGGASAILPPGKTRVTLRMQTRVDALTEGRESFSAVFRSSLGGRSDVVTVHVRD